MADPAEETVRNRWMIINAVRFGGAVMALIAMLILAGRIPVPDAAGYVLLAIGLVDVLLVPTFLARKWRSPDT